MVMEMENAVWENLKSSMVMMMTEWRLHPFRMADYISRALNINYFK